jgi:hypothetical protein
VSGTGGPLDAWSAGGDFQLFERREDPRAGADQQSVDTGAEVGGYGLGNASVDILEKPFQCSIHDALEFPFRGPFHPHVPQPLAGILREALGLLQLTRGFSAQPAFQIILILTCGEAPARVLPELKQVLASRAAVPPIHLGDISSAMPQRLASPQQVQTSCRSAAVKRQCSTSSSCVYEGLKWG